jgi:hypothetical protein
MSSARSRLAQFAAFSIVGIAAPLQAGAILSPTAVLGTDLGTFDPVTALENMINQSGLDKPFSSGVTDFDEYFTTGAPPFGQGRFDLGWQSDFTFTLPLTGFVDFDLGAVYDIDRIAVWNRSLENGNFLVSETLGGPFTSAGSFHLQNKLNFPFSYQPEIVLLDDTVSARYLRFDITSAYKFDITDTFAYAIVGEVAVDVVSDEPPVLTADFDNDLDVDAGDLAEWRAAYALTAVGDADADGDSDGADFLAWQQQLGLTAARAAVSSVPEPSALALVCVAMLACSRRLRRCRPTQLGCCQCTSGLG